MGLLRPCTNSLMEVNMKELEIPTWDNGPGEYMKAVERNHQILEENDQEAKAKGTLVGRYIDHPYADGKAIYIIVRENKLSVKIEVCSGLGDDWVLPAWGGSATIPKETALQFVNSRDNMRKLFKPWKK